MCESACITCGRALLPGCMSSCLPEGWRRCHFDTWSQSLGQPLFPKASPPAQSYLTRMIKNNSWVNTLKFCIYGALMLLCTYFPLIFTRKLELICIYHSNNFQSGDYKRHNKNKILNSSVFLLHNFLKKLG